MNREKNSHWQSNETGRSKNITTQKRYFLNRITFVFLLVFSFTYIVACGNEKKNSLEIGDQSPGFTLPDLQGNEISLADYRNSPVIIRFFLTDCKYCRADTPVFNEYYSRYAQKGLKIVYIDSIDSDPKLLETFRRELGIEFPILVDKGGSVSAKYNVRAMPQTILLDPQHKIRAAILGGVSEEELHNTLGSYIN